MRIIVKFNEMINLNSNKLTIDPVPLSQVYSYIVIIMMNFFKIMFLQNNKEFFFIYDFVNKTLTQQVYDNILVEIFTDIYNNSLSIITMYTNYFYLNNY